MDDFKECSLHMANLAINSINIDLSTIKFMKYRFISTFSTNKLCYCWLSGVTDFLATSWGH